MINYMKKSKNILMLLAYMYLVAEGKTLIPVIELWDQLPAPTKGFFLISTIIRIVLGFILLFAVYKGKNWGRFIWILLNGIVFFMTFSHLCRGYFDFDTIFDCGYSAINIYLMMNESINQRIDNKIDVLKSEDNAV